MLSDITETIDMIPATASTASVDVVRYAQQIFFSFSIDFGAFLMFVTVFV